jgi:hypothetical protein
MKYLLMIYENESVYGEDHDSPTVQAIIERHQAFRATHGALVQSGAGLRSTSAATTVRTQGGAQTIHDGPFAETKEQLGGFYLIDAPDLDAAIAAAKDVPVAADGSIEIRPLLGM